MGKILNKIFNLFGYSVVETFEYENSKTYKEKHKETQNRFDEYIKFVSEEIMPKYLDSLDQYHRVSKELVDLINKTQDYINTVNDLKKDYTNNLSACGTAIDRLMGEMMSKHNYTESEFREILGEYVDVMLYDKIQRYLPNN